MAGIKLVYSLVGLLLLAGIVAAGCSSDAYARACASCINTATGQMDSDCYTREQTAGTACLSAKYPIMSGKYAAGNCSAVDDCISELNSCKTQYSSGNDSADCQEGSVGVCFAAADECMRQAATTCGEVQSPCGGGTTFVLAGLGLAAIVGLASMKKA